MNRLARADWALWRDPEPLRRAWRWLAVSVGLLIVSAGYYAYTLFELHKAQARAAEVAAEAARIKALEPPPGTIAMTQDEWARVQKSIAAITFDWNAEFNRVAGAFVPGTRATRWRFVPFAEDGQLGLITARVSKPSLAADIEERLNATASRCPWRLVLIERVKETTAQPEWDARFECVASQLGGANGTK